MKEVLPRPVYLDRIKPFLGKDIIKILTGMRRAGKSYILLQLIETIREEYPDAHIIHIDMELAAFSSIRTHADLYAFVLGQIHPTGQHFLLIDEVQEITAFERCLRSLLNEGKCDIICTGSNAGLLSGELATMLSGRHITFPVHGLSYIEFLHFHGLAQSADSLVSYLTIGGLPYLRHIGTDQEIAFEYLKSVYSTILLKDVVARENIRNVHFLENLVAFLSDNTGSILSARNITKYLKSQQINIPTQTVLNYLRAITQSYFVYRVPRAEVHGLKIFEVGEKYYFGDTGLRNCVRTFHFPNDIHKLMENAVFLHLSINRYTVFTGRLGDREIDFVAERSGKKIYIQVCYTLSDEQTVAREFGNLLLIEDNFPKYVVTYNDPITDRDYKGIRQVNLIHFLTETL